MFSLPAAILLSSAASLLPALVTARNATTISSDGCVSPSNFDTCIKAAATAEATCINMAGSDELVIACGWAKDASELLCYMSDCWNKVYSCEYQYIASSYIYEHGNDTIPFYPAPLNAPGGCSCNMGDVLNNATASLDLMQSTCSNYVTSDAATLDDCQCCALTAALSAFYGICPKTDPSQLGINHLITEVQQYTSISGACSGMTSKICLGKFDIGSADGDTYVDPNNLPSGGTESLSTTTGSNYPMTSPPGGETMTVTIGSTVHTVTAAAYNAKNVESGATTTGSSAESTGSSGSSGASASASATKSSGGTGNAGHTSKSVPSLVIYAGLFFLAALAWL